MLRRKTPLKARTGFKKRGGKLNPVSNRRRKLNEEYGKVRKEYLEEKNYRCEICGQEATDIHHKKRRGKHLCEKHTFMALCRSCHTRVETDIAWAREKGYLIYEF